MSPTKFYAYSFSAMVGFYCLISSFLTAVVILTLVPPENLSQAEWYAVIAAFSPGIAGFAATVPISKELVEEIKDIEDDDEYDYDTEEVEDTYSKNRKNFVVLTGGRDEQEDS